jgi:hypothetical protein
MIGLHFIGMYILMYAMVNAFNNGFNSFNQVYMAALMTASMILIELPLMSSMYKTRSLNAIIISVGIAVLIGSLLLIRHSGLDFGSSILALNDSASRWSNSNVRKSFKTGPGNQRVV